MTPGGIRKLVGGYGAGILTPEERRALFHAALEDQELFNELGREQVVKELLDDPAARRRLLAALDAAPPPWAKLAGWFRRPLAWGLAGSLAMAVLAAALMWMGPWRKAAQPVLTAMRPAVPEGAEGLAGRAAESANETAARQDTHAAPRRDFPAQPRPAAAPPEAAALQAPPPESKSFALADRGPAETEVEPAAPPAAMARAAAAEAADALRDAAPAAPRDGASGGEIREKALAAPQQAVGRLPAGRAAAAAGALRAPGAVPAETPVPYHLEVAGPQGEWTRAPAGAVFGEQDRVRIVFQPGEAGRLRVTSPAGTVLFDRDVQPGIPVNVEAPPGAAAVTGNFGAAPFKIQLRRSQ